MTDKYMRIHIFINGEVIMKKLVIILLVVSISLLLFSCQQQKSSNIPMPMGIYQPATVQYLWEESMETPSSFLELNKFVLFAFDDNAFIIDTQELKDTSISDRDFEGVTYEESLLGEKLKLGDAHPIEIDLSGYKAKTSYNVLINDTDTGFVIYLLDDKIWVAYMDIKNKPAGTYYLVELHKAYFD